MPRRSWPRRSTDGCGTSPPLRHPRPHRARSGRGPRRCCADGSRRRSVDRGRRSGRPRRGSARPTRWSRRRDLFPTTAKCRRGGAGERAGRAGSRRRRRDLGGPGGVQRHREVLAGPRSAVVSFSGDRSARTSATRAWWPTSPGRRRRWSSWTALPVGAASEMSLAST